MPSNASPALEIRFTPEFKRNLRQLSKKYRHIQRDLQPVIEQLAEGKTIGDQIPGVGYPVFKVRVQNSDIGKGKRAGYRMIYYCKTSTMTVLVTIYAKSEQGDVSANRIRDIIASVDELNS